MKRTGHTHISHEEFRGLFRRGKPVRISRITEVLEVNRSTVTRQMRRHHTLTSINRNSSFCVLPEMCRFDELGFCRFGQTLFFRDGNQRDAICHLVASSDGGMSLSEINEVMGSKMATQALNLVHAGRLRRQRHDSGYVYFAADSEIFEAQVRHRADEKEAEEPSSPEERFGQFLAVESRENIELLTRVLMTCLSHPQFSAKSVALSLIRRGEQVSTKQVCQWFEDFSLRGKNS